MTPLLSTAILRTQSDARLAALAREGHDRAFEAIVERHRRPLLAHARRILPDGRAEDVVQQTFLSAWAALRDGQDVRDLRAWLHRIVHNAALNAHKRAGYDYDELRESLLGAAAPEDDLERRRIMRETLAGVAALPERQREALLRIAVQGASQAEVARDLGISDGALRQLVHRARSTRARRRHGDHPLPHRRPPGRHGRRRAAGGGASGRARGRRRVRRTGRRAGQGRHRGGGGGRRGDGRLHRDPAPPPGRDRDAARAGRGGGGCGSGAGGGGSTAGRRCASPSAAAVAGTGRGAPSATAAAARDGTTAEAATETIGPVSIAPDRVAGTPAPGARVPSAPRTGARGPARSGQGDRRRPTSLRGQAPGPGSGRSEPGDPGSSGPGPSAGEVPAPSPDPLVDGEGQPHGGDGGDSGSGCARARAAGPGSGDG